jgi:hypothetical protein
VAPAILTLAAVPESAKAGSVKPSNNNNNRNNNGNNGNPAADRDGAL